MEWLKIMIRLGSVYFLFSSNSCASFFHSVIELRDQREDARRPPGGGGMKSSVETMFFFAFHNDNYETVIIYQIMFSQRMSEIHLWRNSFRTTFLFYFLYIYTVLVPLKDFSCPLGRLFGSSFSFPLEAYSNINFLLDYGQLSKSQFNCLIWFTMWWKAWWASFSSRWFFLTISSFPRSPLTWRRCVYLSGTFSKLDKSPLPSRISDARENPFRLMPFLCFNPSSRIPPSSGWQSDWTMSEFPHSLLYSSMIVDSLWDSKISSGMVC